MRLFARRCGFSLSDHGICEATHARARGRGPRLWTGPPIAQHRFQTEKDIFDFLGLSYREPWQREVDASWLQETATAAEEASASTAGSPPPPAPTSQPCGVDIGTAGTVGTVILDSESGDEKGRADQWRWGLGMGEE
ncbi:DNA polymerase lambda, partial [Durusdinium trenchii]